MFLLLLVSGFLSTVFDFRVIAQAVGAFKRDLQKYRETLSSDDIEEVAALDSLTMAAKQNSQRWQASVVMYTIAVASLLVAIGVILQGQFSRVFP